MMLRFRASALICLLVLSLATPGAAEPRAASTSVPDFEHVVVLVMENKEYDQIIGSSEAPYLNDLADGYGLATGFYGVTHPSLPNYLALLGGSTFGISSDCTTCHVSRRNLVDQLENANISWKGYMGAMPKACYRKDGGSYAKRHNPFMYFTDIYENRTRCAKVQPIENLTTDLDAGVLPQFSFVSPDLCNDMHDCSIKTGDDYLADLVPRILGGLGSNGVLFITFDEGSTSAGCCRFAHGGHIATIVAGPAIPSPVARATKYDLYSILRTVEEAWGLPLMRHAKCLCSRSMAGFF